MNITRKYRKYTDEEFKLAVASSRSWSQVLKKIGLKAGGGSYVHIQNLALKLEINTDHFLGKGWNIGLKFKPNPPIPLEKILVKDSTYTNTHNIKTRLIKAKLKTGFCENCNRKTWCGRPIPIELHHLNGIRNDHRLENLQILCPNCHAQTKNYCSKK